MEALAAAGMEVPAAALQQQPGAQAEQTLAAQGAGSSSQLQDVSMEDAAAAGGSQSSQGAPNGYAHSGPGAGSLPDIIELPEGLPDAANMPGPKYKCARGAAGRCRVAHT